MAEQKIYTSPRITALERVLSAGDDAALGAFWQDVAQPGAPLMECIEDEPEYSLVTFLWRDKGDTENVVIFGGPAGWQEPAKNQLTRLLESDLWYRTYRVRSDLRTTYVLSHNDPFTDLEYGTDDYYKRVKPDPLNPKVFVYPADEELPEVRELSVSILELPDAPAQTWIMPRPDVPKGRVEMHRLRSDILSNERRVYVYTPPDYTASGEPYGLLLLFDGPAYIDLVPTPTILDNLISEGKIPPIVAIIPDSLDHETRNRELPCHQPFVDFLTDELLPWVHEHYHVTSDPARSIVGGSSYGGLGATFVGLRASDHFGNVLSQSGSFWWDFKDDHPQEWLTQQFISEPRLPLRFYMEVGLQEKDGRVSVMVPPNRHLRDILRLKGYEVEYREFNGGHDYVCWRGSFADGLLALIGIH